MEAVCNGCASGIFSLGSYLGDSDAQFQFLKEHKLVPASRKCPKCESEITITKDYFFRCDRQRQVSLYGGKKKVVRRCGLKISALKGTFFEHSHLSKSQINFSCHIGLY